MNVRNNLIMRLQDKMAQRSNLKPKEYYQANEEGKDVEELFGNFVKLTTQIDEIMLLLLKNVVTEGILDDKLYNLEKES